MNPFLTSKLFGSTLLLERSFALHFPLIASYFLFPASFLIVLHLVIKVTPLRTTAWASKPQLKESLLFDYKITTTM